ncbi:MAG: hypothetical protein ACRDZ8_07055 [Acidimicrobiales bacterium]
MGESKPALSFDERAERVRRAPPPKPDDESIITGGQRLDTKENVLAFLTQIDAERAAGITIEGLQNGTGIITADPDVARLVVATGVRRDMPHR